MAVGLVDSAQHLLRSPLKRRISLQFNFKVERSHRSEEREFYRLLSYTGDVDLNAKVAEWERFHNLARTHGAHNGKTPRIAPGERP